MKLLKILALTAAVTSTSAMAATYQTVISINDLSDTLAWSQAAQMQFATLVLDANAVNGSTCRTYDGRIIANDLCLGDRSEVTDAVYSITGLANASVRVILDNATTTQEGLQFRPILLTGETVNLNFSGEASYNVGGHLTLVDRSQLVSDSLTFTYDLEFSAQ